MRGGDGFKGRSNGKNGAIFLENTKVFFFFVFLFSENEIDVSVTSIQFMFTAIAVLSCPVTLKERQSVTHPIHASG